MTVDDERPAAHEGVRILGAEEAQKVVRARRDDDDDANRDENGADDRTDVMGAVRGPGSSYGARDTEPDAEAIVVDDDVAVVQPELAAPVVQDDWRSRRFPEQGPSWSAANSGAAEPSAPTPAAAEPPTGEVPPLPHWTEPPTGAVPAIVATEDEPAARSAEPDDEFAAWIASTGSQARFRSEGSDWAGADYTEGEVLDESPRLGALAEAPDEEADFARAVEQRRRRPVRASARPAKTVQTTPTRSSDPFAPTAGPGSERDLPTAIATAAVLAVVALLCFNAGTTATAVLVAVIAALAVVEFAAGLRHRNSHPATILALLGAAGIVVGAREVGADAYPVFFGLVTVFSLLWFLWKVGPGRPIIGVASTLLVFGYVGGFAGFAGLILQSPDGVGIILGLALCAIAEDVLGFFVGSQFGKNRIAPHISPNKTVEGTVAGMFGSVAAGVLLASQIHPWDTGSGFALGALVAVGAFLGDLSESMLKRDLGIKDFGSILPGHGGVLDRFDALLFCLPVVYFLAAALDYV